MGCCLWGNLPRNGLPTGERPVLLHVMKSTEELDVESLCSTPASRGRCLVLCPHGMPSRDDARELSVKLLKRYGGDLERIIESHSKSLDHFAEHVSRIALIRERQESPIILLTRTNPLGLSVVRARRRLEARVPFLTSALWVIFWDPQEDPFFVESARSLGKIEPGNERAAIWTSAGGRHFLVWSTESPAPEQASG